MSKNHYDWDFNSPSIIEQHSLAKHEIIETYLISYIQTLISSPHQEELRLTLIDGFSGGGIYQHALTKETVYGSPLVMLKAVKEANRLIHQGRQKSVDLKIDYFFIDKNKSACECLKETLIASNYESLINKSVQVLESSFDIQADNIIQFIKKKSPKAGRAIFLLDQYGYSEVPAPLIRKILNSLPNAEIILTFNVDSFLTYATDKKDQAQNLLNKTGIPDALKGRTIEDIKQSEKDWRLFIQSCLYQELVQNCGAPFYTPFFIRSSQGHGDYWLIHLSQHHRARDVMTQVHWQKNNYFIHYGKAGLDMFSSLMVGYVPDRDSLYTGQNELLDFCFDNLAEERSIDALMHEIPHLVYADLKGISFEKLFKNTCNSSPASAEVYKKAIAKLIELKEVVVLSQNGAKRLSANTIHDKDQIIAPRQHSLFQF